MAELTSVLSTIHDALADVENRVRQKSDLGMLPAIAFTEVTDRAAQTNEILIGFGRMDYPILDGQGIVLNNKGVSPALGFAGDLDCITDLVLTAPDRLFEAWARVVGDDFPPQRLFRRFALSVEDASPDSCLGFLCLLLRLNGVLPESIHPSWIAYIRNWEMGKATSGPSPLSEYGCLHNALVHSRIESDVRGAWLDGLRLMIASLAGDCAPTSMSGIHTSELRRARAFLSYEEQLYEESLRAMSPLQLLVPMAGGVNRSRLVDAYIGIESIPIGSLKAFARTDRVHPFLKNGFALMAIYRPIAEHRGNDFTFSLDPDTGLDLTRLWEELERREDLRWAGMRPSDNPRAGMVGYPKGKRPDGTAAPDQPWYLQRDRTLIGAPRSLADHRPGTRLGWNDVRDALWSVFNPFRDVMVRPSALPVSSDHPTRLLHECTPEPPPFLYQAPDQAAHRRLLVAGWHRRDNADQVLWRTPTLERYLAALVNREPSTALPHVKDLPEASAYDVLELSNGLAVITDRGAFLLESEQQTDSTFAPLSKQFFQAEELLAKIENGLNRIDPLFQAVQQHIDGNTTRRSLGDLAFLHLLAHEQFEITLELNKTRFAESPPDADRFREALLERWGVAGRLEALAVAIEQVREILESHAELIAGRRFAFLQTYGVPLLLAAGLVAIVPDLVKEKMNWLLLAQTAIAFAVITVVGTFTIVAASWVIDEQARRRRSKVLAEHRAQNVKTGSQSSI